MSTIGNGNGNIMHARTWVTLFNHFGGLALLAVLLFWHGGRLVSAIDKNTEAVTSGRWVLAIDENTKAVRELLSVVTTGWNQANRDQSDGRASAVRDVEAKIEAAKAEILRAVEKREEK